MKEKQVEFVDLRFTDPKGKLQHLTIDATVVDEDMLDKGVFFDGSSIAGWKAINESDMILKPDLERPIIDPFNSHTTLNIFCDTGMCINKYVAERGYIQNDQKMIHLISRSFHFLSSFFCPRKPYKQ